MVFKESLIAAGSNGHGVVMSYRSRVARTRKAEGIYDHRFSLARTRELTSFNRRSGNLCWTWKYKRQGKKNPKRRNMKLNSTVHIIDDNPRDRQNQVNLLQSVNLRVACHDSARAFMRKQSVLMPGCLLLELRAPGLGGLELQSLLRARGSHMPIIFLTRYGNVSSAVRAMQAGAMDFLMKPANKDMLIEKVRKAIEIDRERIRSMRLKECVMARLELLTPRERDVLDGVLAGKTNRQIADSLDISHKTVELHRGNMMTKMHATSIAELVRLWFSVASSFQPTTRQPLAHSNQALQAAAST